MAYGTLIVILFQEPVSRLQSIHLEMILYLIIKVF